MTNDKKTSATILYTSRSKFARKRISGNFIFLNDETCAGSGQMESGGRERAVYSAKVESTVLAIHSSIMVLDYRCWFLLLPEVNSVN